MHPSAILYSIERQFPSVSLAPSISCRKVIFIEVGDIFLSVCKKNEVNSNQQASGKCPTHDNNTCIVYEILVQEGKPEPVMEMFL